MVALLLLLLLLILVLLLMHVVNVEMLKTILYHCNAIICIESCNSALQKNLLVCACVHTESKKKHGIFEPQRKMNLDTIPTSKSVDNLPTSDSMHFNEEMQHDEDEETDVPLKDPMKSIPMTFQNLKKIIEKIARALDNSQRRITCLSVLYLIIFCLTINVIVITEHVFFKKNTVLDRDSALLNQATMKPHRSILYSYTGTLLGNLFITVLFGMLSGGVKVDKISVKIHSFMASIFTLSVLVFIVLSAGELVMYGLLAGKRMIDHHCIPIVIMCFLEVILLVLSLSSLVVMFQHWRILRAYKRYSTLNLAKHGI